MSFRSLAKTPVVCVSRVSAQTPVSVVLVPVGPTRNAAVSLVTVGREKLVAPFLCYLGVAYPLEAVGHVERSDGWLKKTQSHRRSWPWLPQENLDRSDRHGLPSAVSN